MNSQKRRRSLWIVAGLLVFATLIGGYWGWQEQNRQQVRLLDFESRVTAFEDRLLTREQVLSEIRLLETRNPSGSLLLQGSTAAIAAAELQGIVNQIIEQAGGRVESADLIRPEPLKPFLEVGVALNFMATIEALRDILLNLEKSVPAIVVTTIDATQVDDVTRELRVLLHVKGFAAVAAS